MSTQHTSDNGGQSIGVGQENDAKAAGADGSHAETGGSGGSGLTGTQVESVATDPSQQAGMPPGAPDSAMTASNHGAQDTRSRQGAAHPTGLGSAETGATQQAADLAPPPAPRAPAQK